MVSSMYIQGIINVQLLFIKCTLKVSSMYIEGIINVQLLFIKCTLKVPLMYNRDNRYVH